MQHVVTYAVDTKRPGGASRSLEDHLLVGWPSLYRALSGLVMRLSTRSRLRRAAFRRSIRRAFAAFNRRDFDLLLLHLAPDIEYESPAGMHPLGFSERLRGRDAVVARVREALHDWAKWELSPAWMVDLGRELVVLGHVTTQGRESGIQVTGEWASAFLVRDGLMASQRDFLGWQEALEAVGLDLGRPPVAGLARRPSD